MAEAVAITVAVAAVVTAAPPAEAAAVAAEAAVRAAAAAVMAVEAEAAGAAAASPRRGPSWTTKSRSKFTFSGDRRPRTWFAAFLFGQRKRRRILTQRTF